MGNELKKANEAIHIIYDPSLCSDCLRGMKHSGYEDIISIDVAEARDVYWVLQGSGQYRGFCPQCGKLYVALEHIIPIECASFPCPNCNLLQNLEYKIQRIQVEKGTFQFEAKIICKKCNKKFTFQKTLEKIFSILKVTVGPTGITISKD